jgi:hypothetical protein
MAKTNLTPIYINVDHAALPGHVVLAKEDWDKVMKHFNETTTVAEFNEEESTFINHQHGECNDDCPICKLDILFHERNKNETN